MLLSALGQSRSASVVIAYIMVNLVVPVICQKESTINAKYVFKEEQQFYWRLRLSKIGVFLF